MAEPLDEIYPGEILLEHFMKPMGISARQLAADIDVSPSRLSELVHGTRPITANTALRLGMFFSMEARFWTGCASCQPTSGSPRREAEIGSFLRLRHRAVCPNSNGAA